MRISVFEVKKMRKAVVWLLCATLLVSALLGGCAKDNGNTAETGAPQTGATADEPESTDAETAAETPTGTSGKTKPEKKEKTEATTSPEILSLSQTLNNDIDAMGFSGAVYAEWNGTPLVSRDSGTACRLASVSKQFTAAAILLLEEQGLLSVNDSVQKYFPTLRSSGTLTLHHLLCMRSGMPDYLLGGKSALLGVYGVSAWNTAEQNRALVLQWILDNTDAVPDAPYSYCNSNYFLLAEVIEQVSGVSYETYIRRHIFEPLGMNSSGFSDSWDGAVACTDGWGENEWFGYPGVRRGAADMVASASDLGVWAHELMPGKGRVLSASIVQKMTADYGGYGYGLMQDWEFGAVYHLGSLTPYNTVFSVKADKEFTLVMLDTRWNTSLTQTYRQIMTDFCFR